MNLPNFVEQKINQYKLPFTLEDIQNWTDRSKYIDSYLYKNKNIDDVDDFFKLYEKCIKLAIHNCNWKLIKCMWQGYYYHDRNNPDFNNIFLMSECGDIKTLILGLEGILNWGSGDVIIEFTCEELRELAIRNNNEEITKFLDKIIENPELNKILRVQEEQYNNEFDNNADDIWFTNLCNIRKIAVKTLMKEVGMYDEYIIIKRLSPPPEDI